MESDRVDAGLHELPPGPNRLARTRHGTLLFNPRDRYVGRSLQLYGEYSEEEVRLLTGLVRPGAVVLDVGAHVGALTVPLARAVGPEGGVLAFEPQRLLFQTLCANLALSSLLNTFVYHAATGAQAGVVLVPQLDAFTECNFAGLGLGEHSEGERVRLLTIDELALQRCDLLKVDVEGMERETLQGAAATIERFRPVLYVENDRVERSAALIEHIQSLGYDLYWHLPPLYDPRNFAGNPQDVFQGTVSVNMLGFHRGLGVQVDGLLRVAGPEHRPL